MSYRVLHVLLVEDDVVSVMGVRRAFEKLRIANPLVVAKDGTEALASLRGGGGREALARPFVIVLDLNLPRLDGRSFLAELRGDPDLSGSLVFVLTTSREQTDRSAAADYGVAAYLVKSDFVRDVETIVGLLDQESREGHILLTLPEEVSPRDRFRSDTASRSRRPAPW